MQWSTKWFVVSASRLQVQSALIVSWKDCLNLWSLSCLKFTSSRVRYFTPLGLRLGKILFGAQWCSHWRREVRVVRGPCPPPPFSISEPSKVQKFKYQISVSNIILFLHALRNFTDHKSNIFFSFHVGPSEKVWCHKAFLINLSWFFVVFTNNKSISKHKN